MVLSGENQDLVYAEYAECDIPGELEAVRTAIEKLRAWCLRFGLQSRFWADIELAVVEGVNNAIEHACEGVPGARVQVRWSWTDDFLDIRIIDPSNFLPEGEIEAALPEDILAESGRGAFLMKTMMDSVEHQLVGGQHAIVLRKRVGAKVEPVAEPDSETAALLQGMIEDLSTNYENLSALFRFAEQLASSSSFEDFLGEALDQLLELVGGIEAQVRLDDSPQTVNLHYAHGAVLPLAPLLAERVSVESEVLRSGSQNTVQSCAELLHDDPVWRESGGAFACPVRFREEALGVLTVIQPGGAAYFSAAQINIVRVVAEFIGIARATATLQAQRANEQRAIRELEVAAEIQQSLLPKEFPDMPKTRIFGLSQASREIGGDYFDIIPIEGKGVLVAIADVMGKGMPAALLATILRAAIRARLSLAGVPGFLLTDVNRQMKGDLAQVDMFITTQLAFFPYYGNEVVFASAGHCPMLKIRPGTNHVEQIHEGGVPLGVLDNTRYNSSVTPMSSGDRFLFITDGIYEALSPEGQMLGLDGIEGEILSLANGTPSAFCVKLLEFVRNFSGGAQAADDRTLLVVERL